MLLHPCYHSLTCSIYSTSYPSVRPKQGYPDAMNAYAPVNLDIAGLMDPRSSQFNHRPPFFQPYLQYPPESCSSNSPYPSIPAAVPTSEHHEPGSYACPPTDDLKASLGLDLGIGLSMPPASIHHTWDCEPNIAEGEYGDDDAEGEEVDISDIEQQFPCLLTASPGLPEADDQAPTHESDGSKYSEEDSLTDSSDDSEFLPGSSFPRRRPQQSTVSASYPSYTSQGRSLRTRSGTRYTPYPSEFSATNMVDYFDHDSSTTTKRLSTPLLDADFDFPNVNFTTLSASSTTVSRRRPRPSNSLPVPVPVPNLTKKSRGRRVPTVSSLENLRSASSGAGRKRQTAGKTARMYLCEVEGCGKCFARGEHLKRHVRSIHTYEKRKRVIRFLILFSHRHASPSMSLSRLWQGLQQT